MIRNYGAIEEVIIDMWLSVNKNRKCRICGRTKWCSHSSDDSISICRFVLDGSTGKTKTDQAGSQYTVVNHQNSNILSYPKVYAGKTKLKRPSKNKVIPKVYESVINSLQLNKEHENNLSLDRGLPIEEIVIRQYRSYSYSKDYKSLMLFLQKIFSDEELLKTPGFRKKDGRVICSFPEGLIIPVRNIKGEITSLKVRTLDQDNKYLYISSKRHGGVGARASVHFPIYPKSEHSSVMITEGELKADIATVIRKELCISIPGVQSWKLAINAIKKTKTNNVILAFDSDTSSKKHVGCALVKLHKELKKNGYKVRCATW